VKPDEEEFRQFVAARMDRLRGLAFLTCGNRQVAEDAVSTSLAKLYVRWGKVSSQGPAAGRGDRRTRPPGCCARARTPAAR
jgi:DNA-directed RNA polymerase specialized sigma24 family protein